MLVIKKILSKKIKYPLLLRGLFPFCHSRLLFCHSREGGNPSSRSLRNDRSNRSGFSLIELMVAVVILAIAILGIFHAYSVGFMGMADARDRTVATNYAREAMEDIKNMDFEKIITTTKSVISSNTKYRIDVNVSLEEHKKKKVITVISWKDRNGINKKMETTMLVNFIEIFASNAAKIVLFADSYTILNNDSTDLTAIIKDVKGNTITDWGVRAGEGDVNFSISFGDGFGALSYTNVTPTNGVAKTNFTYSNASLGEGVSNTTIEASVSLPIIGNVTDQVTIRVTNGPVKIMLSADPDIIKASTGNTSTITVSLCNAANQILNKSDLITDVEINFSYFGEGSLSISTITIPAIGAEPASAEITLNSTGTPGLASVMATASDLESDIVDVRFLGPPVSILVTANPNPIYEDDDDGSTITVSLLDVNDFCTNPTDSNILVNFTLSPDTNGFLSPSSLTFITNEFEGIPLTAVFSGQISTDPVTITAFGGGLTEGSVTINILSALVPDHIELTARPQNVPADGESTSTITATVYAINGKIVTNYTGTITFITDLGNFTVQNFANGIATVKLSSVNAGTATVTVSSSDDLGYLPSGGVEVGFYGGADHITLTATPEYVKADGASISTIKATVYDSFGFIVTDYNIYEDKTINFYINDTFFSTNNFYNGIATITLSSDSAGAVTITAFPSDVLLDCLPSGGVEVEFYVDTTLKLVADSAEYNPADFEVVFGVIVAGGDILVDEMGISWTDSAATERFQKIVIDTEDVYTGNSLSGAIVDIVDTTLTAGESYIIKLTFGKDVGGRDFTVIFYPYTGSYQVKFSPTTQ